MRLAGPLAAAARWPGATVAVLAFATFVGCLAAYFAGFPYVCTDDLTRIYWALNWWADPYVVRVSYWLPGHAAATGAILAWSGNPLTAAHVLNGLLCAANFFQFYSLGAAFFRRTDAALAATAFFALLPMRVWINLSALAEPLFTTFFLGWLWCALRWTRGEGVRWLAYAVFLCFCMGMTRQQGWMLSGLFGAYVLYRRRDAAGILWAGLALAAPFALGLYSWARFGEALYMVRTYAEDSRQYYAAARQPNEIPFVAFATLYALESLLLIGAARWWRDLSRPTRIAVAGAAGLFALEVFSVWNQMPTVQRERVVYFSGLLACFGAGGVAVDAWRAGRARGFLVAVVAAGFALQAWAFHRLRPNFPPTLAATARALTRSPRWMAALDGGVVATDQDTLMIYAMELIHNRSGIYNRLEYADGRLNVLAPRAPAVFLIESADLKATVAAAFPALRRVDLGDYAVFTADEPLLRELRLRR